MKIGEHQGTRSANMGAPALDLREAEGIWIAGRTAILVLAHRIGTGMSLIHKMLQIDGVVVRGDRSHELGSGRELLELGHRAIPVFSPPP